MRNTLRLLAFLCLSTACSGGAGGVLGGGPVGNEGIAGAPSQGVVSRAAPGAEEVVLGPGAADPNDLQAAFDCEIRCEEGSLSLKGRFDPQAKALPGRRLRVVESMIEDKTSRYRDLIPDAQGEFEISFLGNQLRKLRFVLVKLSGSDSSLDSVQPCPNDSCLEVGMGELVELMGVSTGEGCERLLNPEDMLCTPQLNHPLLHKIDIP